MNGKSSRYGGADKEITGVMNPGILRKQEEIKMGAIKIPSADLLKKIYGETEESSARFTSLAENFEKKYHHDNAEFFTAPGRTEIIGNHVDHNGGQIMLQVSTLILLVLHALTEPM